MGVCVSWNALPYYIESFKRVASWQFFVAIFIFWSKIALQGRYKSAFKNYIIKAKFEYIFEIMFNAKYKQKLNIIKPNETCHRLYYVMHIFNNVITLNNINIDKYIIIDNNI